jgi:hypothetical protein
MCRSFTISAAVPRQRSHSQARVPRDSWPHFTRDVPNQEGQVPVFISLRNSVVKLYPQALGSLFVASYDSQDHGGGIRPCLHAGIAIAPQSQSHVATDGQSVSKSWCRAPCGAHDQIFLTLWQLRSCFYGGDLSGERTGLSFVYAAGLCQRSLSRVRVPIIMSGPRHAPHIKHRLLQIWHNILWRGLMPLHFSIRPSPWRPLFFIRFFLWIK